MVDNLHPIDVMGKGLGVMHDRFVMCLRGCYENKDHELGEFVYFADIMHCWQYFCISHNQIFRLI